MNPDQRADEAVAPAAALVCAVADRDRDEIARVLSTITDWRALVVVLAAHVSPDSHLGPNPIPVTPEAIANVVLDEVTARWGVTIPDLASTSRRRDILDARAVAMAAMRYAGLTSVYIGQRLSKDHSTVLHAAGRVGEDSRLRRVAVDIAGITGAGGLGALGDADDTAA